MNLRPFFSFYGGKWRIAKRYPAPEHDIIIEPFAGSAGYSLRYPENRVILIEKDEKIAGVWKYLLKASESEILELPDVLPGQTVDDLVKVSPEAKWLIGFWLNKGCSSPRKTMSKWGAEDPNQFWGVKIRERIASQLDLIRHWKVRHCNFGDVPNVSATWFVDPPYQQAGRHYRHGSSDIDFGQLGSWCKNRRGQVIVCENEGADWLSFKPFVHAKANESKSGGKVSKEAIWTRSSHDET